MWCNKMGVTLLKYPDRSQKRLFGIKLNQAKLFLLQEGGVKSAAQKGQLWKLGGGKLMTPLWESG